MTGRRSAHAATAAVPGAAAEPSTSVTVGDLSGLRADLLRARRGDGAAAGAHGSPDLWIEDPVTLPATHLVVDPADDVGSEHATGPVLDLTVHPAVDPTVDPTVDPDAPAAGEDTALHPDDLVALHDLPLPAGAAWEPRPRPRAATDGLSLWDDPEDLAPDEPLRRRRSGSVGAQERAPRRRWPVVAAAVLAFLVGASASALVTEAQVGDARAETAEALAAAKEARAEAQQARTALQDARQRSDVTAPVPLPAEPPTPDDPQAGAAGDAGGDPPGDAGDDASGDAPPEVPGAGDDAPAAGDAAPGEASTTPSAAGPAGSGASGGRSTEGTSPGAGDGAARSLTSTSTSTSTASGAGEDTGADTSADTGACPLGEAPEGDAAGGDGPAVCP